ncbi:MAG TPA: L-histidine N(alpha)-methyltransferase [Candidatus Dormibacteraeota bacterium]|jgi:L-histidine N-alpha-methyltransferase|nr:L-histidine N(alpha)-methyltransferase [Candidatus Dormibacteraeota bacterium]
MDVSETLEGDATGIFDGATVELRGERVSLSTAPLHGQTSDRDALIADVRRGLGAPRKWLPPRWFYDDRGSELFEEITELPEYYPTRTEASILDSSAARIAELTAPQTLVELGAGSCTKTRVLIAHMLRHGLRRFVPVDVSRGALDAAASGLAHEFEHLHVHGVVGDFVDGMERVARAGRQVIAFLGSTIGNLLPHERVALLRRVRARLDADGAFLLGIDLVKPADVLVPAYDDSAGVTAAFNRNVLTVLNRELDAGFDVDAFAHEARWEPELSRVEMHLRSEREQWVEIPGASMSVHFARNETVLTETSAKFTRGRAEAELAAADMRVAHWFSDPGERFALLLGVPA